MKPLGISLVENEEGGNLGNFNWWQYNRFLHRINDYNDDAAAADDDDDDDDGNDVMVFAL